MEDWLLRSLEQRGDVQPPAGCTSAFGGKQIDELRNYLASIPPGRVADIDRLIGLLRESWSQFSASDQTRMEGRKLDRGIESVEWNPPRLTFTIVRHGAAVVGQSGRGELQCWALDLSEGTATSQVVGIRQLRPMQPRMDATQIAATLADAILSGVDDPRIDRRADGSIQVLIGTIVPEGSQPKQTVIGRRRRLQAALNDELGQRGWQEVKGGRGWQFAPGRPAAE
ncbi:MAG: hypothetical protein WD645_06705 [Dehalococcoidia bacterium]